MEHLEHGSQLAAEVGSFPLRTESWLGTLWKRRRGRVYSWRAAGKPRYLPNDKRRYLGTGNLEPGNGQFHPGWRPSGDVGTVRSTCYLYLHLARHTPPGQLETWKYRWDRGQLDEKATCTVYMQGVTGCKYR